MINIKMDRHEVVTAVHKYICETWPKSANIVKINYDTEAISIRFGKPLANIPFTRICSLSKLAFVGALADVSGKIQRFENSIDAARNNKMEDRNPTSLLRTRYASGRYSSILSCYDIVLGVTQLWLHLSGRKIIAVSYGKDFESTLDLIEAILSQ